MTKYNSLEKLYKKVKPIPIDRQVIAMCVSDKAPAVPLGILLSQFKFCVINNIEDSDYSVLRKVLVSLAEEESIKRLEGLK